ncbi:MAG TPA: carboxypeptidase regulatory-like domain-containing protein [Silvibacterium sp.]|nr:carboxypeptidase regulatory-like domain-containing protein [Silvibacterium sp.]
MKGRNARKLTVSRLVFVYAVLLCAGVAAAFGQAAGRGGITGTVSDTSGAIVPRASVTAKDDATGATLSTVSTDSGLYSFISLAPGTYDITATAKGFSTTVRQNVVVTVDQVSTINFALSVGTVNQVVTVTDTTELVDTSNSTVGQLIGAATIDRVPLLTRNVFDLIQLSAGVTPANGTPNSSSSFDIQNISSGRPGVDVSSYSVNGAVEGSVYYMVDGSPIGIAENNAAAIIPAMDLPEDDVDEIRVETQNTPASYQSGAAGVISLATKSGTDKYHGDAFVALRPDILAANEYFNKQFAESSGQPNTPPSFHRYQEGGAIGGPILHEKVFFFGDYEATQQQLFDGSNRFVVPTTAERTGDFSADPFTIYNPTVPDQANGTRQPFANNMVTNPSPIAEKFLSEMPKCNISNVPGVPCDQASDDLTPNFFLPGLDPTSAQKFDVRIDWAKSERQRIFGRFSFDRLFTSTFNSFGNEWDLNFAQNVTNGRNILLADDLTLNATTVLQLRYSFTRHYENQGGDPGQVGADITSLGFPASLAAQENLKLLPFVIFNDSGSGVGGTADFNTFIFASQNNDASVGLTKVLGKHEISTGFEYMKRLLNVGQPIAPAGSYEFDTTGTNQTTNSGIGSGSDFASFLVGIGTTPGNESSNYPNFSKDLFEAEASPYYGTFIQDTWHPTPSLTVTAGLRWDIFGGRTERHNRLEYFDRNATATVSGVAYTGAEVYVNNHNRSPFTTNLADFGPRLGLSWQPLKNVVVRAGAGIYYGPSPEMVGSANLDSDGFATQTTWNATAFNNDPNTIAFDCAQDPSLCGLQGNTVILNPLSNPFPNGIIAPITNPTGLANNLGNSLQTVLHSERTPTTYNFNFGVDYQFPHEVILSAAYVGSRGLFLPFSSVDLNQLDLGTINHYQAALMNSQVPNQWANIQPPTNANSGSPTVPLFVSVQPYPQFGNGSYGAGNGVNVNGYPGGDSDYSSLQTKLQKRLTHHFTMLSSFTWAKLITDDGNPPLGFVGSHNGSPQDWKDLQFEHSVSPQDVKYQFTGEASYDLPIGRDRAIRLNRVADAVAGGWTMNGIVYWSTGIPIASPVVGADTSFFNQRPDLACDPSKGAPHTPDVWFNPNCFVLPASPFVPGNAPAYLDHVRTAGAKDVDLSLYKTFQIKEGKNLRFDISAYNVANHAQFGQPNVPSVTTVNTSTVDSPANFGLIQSTVNNPRQFQFGARFTF